MGLPSLRFGPVRSGSANASATSRVPIELVLPLITAFLGTLVPPGCSSFYLTVEVSPASPNAVIHIQYLFNASTCKSIGGPRRGERKRYLIEPLRAVDGRA